MLKTCPPRLGRRPEQRVGIFLAAAEAHEVPLAANRVGEKVSGTFKKMCGQGGAIVLQVCQVAFR